MAYVETTSGAQFSSAQHVTTTADSTNVFDVTGAGSGTAPAMIGAGGVNTAMGYDIGAGDGMAIPTVFINVTTSTTVTGTLTISIKAAPDNGSYGQGSYTTLLSTAALTGAQLAVNSVIKLPVPPIVPGEALPRFYKLTYTVSAAIDVILSANLVINAPDLRDATLYGNNFVSI